MKKFSLLSLIIAISMIGFGCATQNGATGKMDSATAIAKIAELQNRAQSAAEAFKQSHPTSDATYIAVRSKYKDAAAKNHGGAGSRSPIVTVRSVGYRFDATVP